MFNSSKKVQFAFFTAFCICSYLVTRFYLITAVPGFHFDEAWQALYGWRIASEPKFWPTRAMNDYTWPVIHYGLALAFKLFTPTLIVERLFHQFLQLTGFALLLLALQQSQINRRVWAWFVLLFIFLPYFIHTQRYYVEMTSLFTLCAGLGAWGITLWQKRPLLAAALCASAGILGTYAHILFIAPLVATVIIFCTPSATQKIKDPVHIVAAFIMLCTLPVLLRMHMALNKFSTLALLVGMSALMVGQILFYCRGSHKIVTQILRINSLLLKAVPFIAMPFFFPYMGLFIDGSWAYAQVTGAPLGRLWLPVNFIFLIYVFIKTKNIKSNKIEQTIFALFILTFLLTSIIILKQSPRYYVVPSLLGLIYFALKASHLPKRAGVVAALIFISWNSYAFCNRYIEPYQSYGAQDKTYRFLIFKDSARDMRPFQKVFAWLEERGCLHTLKGVEDDRFYRALEFYQLLHKLGPEAALVNSTKLCPWTSEDLHFRSKPGGERNDFPGNLELLASYPEWGDLALWRVRR